MTETSNQIHEGTAVVPCLLLLIMLLIGGCRESRWLRHFEVNETGFDAEVMQVIAKDTGLIFPAGTKGLHFQYKPPIDPAFIAKLEIPTEARQQMLAQIGVMKNEQMHVSGALGAKVNWWLGPDESVLVDRQYTRSDGAYLRAVLTTNGNRLFLYVSHAVV